MILARFLIGVVAVVVTYYIIKILFPKSEIETIKEKVEEDVILAKEVDKLDKLASSVNIKKSKKKLEKLKRSWNGNFRI